MKFLSIIVLCALLIQNPLLGQNTTNILNGTALLYIFPFSADTIKDPSGSKLTRKQKRRQGKAVQKTDFTLSKEKKVADKLYEALGYMAAAEKYESLKGMERNRFVLSKLATSYRLNGQTEDAEYCYSQIIDESSSPDEMLHYAQVLQSNGKCEDAVRWYRNYLEVAFDSKREFILDCETLTEFKESDVELENLAEINTEHLDFSPIPYKDGIVFTSNRGTSQLAIRKDTWTKNSFSDLFFAKKGKEGNVLNVEELGGEINGKFHDGVPTFNSAGTMMVFTRNNKKGRDSEGNRLLKLYTAEMEAGYWINAEELPLNSDEFSNCHPALSKDGRRLYFSSDRLGGFGGMDLYVSENIGGTWREPSNLGPIVNSAGNEVFPFLGDDDVLYFSSDGHLGVGGLDVFSIKKNNPNDENSWAVRENIGRPFNSPKDDFGFNISKDGESGYLTSNRAGGKGGDDIYEWKGSLEDKNAKTNSLERSICVYDPSSGNKIEDVSVTVLETAENQSVEGINNGDLFLTLKPLDNRNQEYVLSIIEKNNNAVNEASNFKTDERGSFSYIPEPQNNYIFVLEKEGYHTNRQTVKATEILDDSEYCFTLEKRTCLSLNGLVKNKDFPALIPDAEVKLFNKCTGQVEATFSDSKGTFDFCLDCGCEYEIYASKPNFEGTKTLVSTIEQDCEEIEMQKPMVATIDMKVVENPNLYLNEENNPNSKNANNHPGNVAPYSTPIWNQPNGNAPNGQANVIYIPVPGAYSNGNLPKKPQDLNSYFLGDPSKPFEEGQLIKLSNIYYDFDKYHIRGDAARELDHLYNLLQAYPTMEIALMAHTDARGSDRYNNWLSRKRAKAAVQYLLDRGVDAKRLINIGLGERKLANECEDGSPCSEEEHQKNRRTEIRILKLNEPGVRVEYEE